MRCCCKKFVSFFTFVYESRLTSVDDHTSIQRLNQVTLDNVKDGNLQLLYIATQTASINLKVNTAIGKVLKIYRRVLGTTSALSSIPLASAANRASAALAVCKAIVQCFGLPTVNHQTVLEIVKSNVWDDAGHNALVLFTDAVATLGMFSTVAFGGMPFFLAAGAFNFPFIIPATTRLMLMLASDLILILVSAFRSTATTCIGQPEEKHIQRAARDYRRISGDVHREIFKLVPKRNVVKSFRYGKVRLGLEDIIKRFQEKVTKDSMSDHSSAEGKRSFDSDRTLISDQFQETKKLVSESKAELRNKAPEIREFITDKMKL